MESPGWHTLDDFITGGPPGLPVCQRNLDEMLSSCRRLGPVYTMLQIIVMEVYAHAQK